MAEKRNPTKHTEERSGRESSDGPPDLPPGAERAEYADYDAEGTERRERGTETAGGEKADDAAEAHREADLQPDGNPDESVRDR